MTRSDDSINPATGREWTLKAAVAAVMVEAKTAAGAICSARTLMYQVRPRIQKLVGVDRPLVYKYFATKLLPELQERINFAEVVTMVKRRHPEVVGVIDEQRVRDWFAAAAHNETKPWRTAVETLVDDDIEAVTMVNDTVRDLVIEQLNEA